MAKSFSAISPAVWITLMLADLVVLPAPRFMLSSFVHQIYEAAISHSPPVFKRKNPLEKPSLPTDKGAGDKGAQSRGLEEEG